MMSAPKNSARTVPEGNLRAVSFKGDAWKKAAAWSVVTFALSLGVGVIAWSWYLGKQPTWENGFVFRRGERKAADSGAPNMPVATAPDAPRRAIDGVRIADGDAVSMRYHAAMLDNIPVARPQAGIAEASVVYEALVEGGLTRFMAVYPETAVSKRIGPVRSARPYFIDWALEYDAQYVHVGGSPEALTKIEDVDARDLNEMHAGAAFWRDRTRDAPHNTYTSMALLSEAFTKRHGDRAVTALRGWRFKDDAPIEDRAKEQAIAISYGHPNIDVKWTFDPATDSYRRAQGKKTADESGAPILAKNVIVLFMKTSTIDAVGRQRVETLGSGDAIFAFDGNAYHGTWKKASKSGRTLFFDGAGKEMTLNAGPIWVQVVPTDAKVTVTP